MSTNGHSKSSHPELPQPELRRVAVEAGCDPRSIVRYLRQAPTHSTSKQRIEKALAACGYGRLVLQAPTRARDSTLPPAGER
jgi:hypothetical protein